MEDLGSRVQFGNISCYSHSCGPLSTAPGADQVAAEEAVNGIAWAHSMAGLPSPTADPFVRLVIDGFKRSLAKPTTKKVAFTANMLKNIADDALTDKSLTNIQLAAMCLFGFAGFF